MCLQALVKFCNIVLRREEKTETVDQTPAKDNEEEEQKKTDCEKETGEMIGKNIITCLVWLINELVISFP